MNRGVKTRGEGKSRYLLFETGFEGGREEVYVSIPKLRVSIRKKEGKKGQLPPPLKKNHFLRESGERRKEDLQDCGGQEKEKAFLSPLHNRQKKGGDIEYDV